MHLAARVSSEGCFGRPRSPKDGVADLKPTLFSLLGLKGAGLSGEPMVRGHCSTLRAKLKGLKRLRRLRCVLCRLEYWHLSRETFERGPIQLESRPVISSTSNLRLCSVPIRMHWLPIKMFS